MSITCCYIKEQYFKDHSSFVKMLDPGNTAKQSHRSYLCLKITNDGNDYYLPLRNNLGADVRPYGRIGHSVPSASRSDAGLDYRYALIVNDSKYLEIPTTQKINVHGIFFKRFIFRCPFLYRQVLHAVMITNVVFITCTLFVNTNLYVYKNSIVPDTNVVSGFWLIFNFVTIDMQRIFV